MKLKLDPNALMQEGRYLFTPDEIPLIHEFSFFTKPSMRHLIFQSKERFTARGAKLAGNGLVEAGAIVRLGSKIMIDINGLRRWLVAARTNVAVEETNSNATFKVKP